MTELEAAQGIRDGLLPSPWKHENMTLFAVRVTGTGMSYRDSLDEYVWRSPEIFLAPDFVARVSGLPLIWEHPKKGSLNSDEFSDRVIGSLMFGFIKSDEVWGIARVYDEAAITLMTEGQLSTSPGVVFKGTDGNTKIDVDGDKTLLIEGKPSTLCHLAVCQAGVWDKGGDPAGIQNDNLPSDSKENLRMAEETKREERDDAAMHEKLDAIMDSLKSAHSRMDAMDAADKARKDAEEEREKAEREEREDAARKDAARHDRCDKHRSDRFGHRKDGESHKDWSKRHDADEAAMCDAMRKDGADEEEAREDARRARHDAEEKERGEGGESFKKWAEEEAKEGEHKDSRKDGEDEPKEEEMKPDARHDAQAAEIADLKRQLAAVAARFVPVSPDERNALAAAQARADGVAGLFGKRASGPIAGETSLDYRRRLANDFKSHSDRYKDKSLASLDSDMLGLVEEQIYADAAVAARSPDRAGAGVLIPITEPDMAGRQITRYTGDNMAWMQHFMTQGASGRILRNPQAGV